MKTSRSAGKRLALAATLLGPLLQATAVYPHAEIEVQVADLSRRISRDPENACLYLQRGELHRAHRDWTRALADYEKAFRIDAGLHLVHLSVGKLLIDLDEPVLAMVSLNRFLARQPHHADALALRARMLVRLGDLRAGAEEYTRAIDELQGAGTPPPDHYLERAKALAAQGKEHVAEALLGLDEGLRRLGEPVTLELCAIDLELEKEDYTRALERLERIANRSPRKEAWLARRGEILLKANRISQAQRVFEESLAAIEALPARCRNTRATEQLTAHVRAALSSIPGASPASEPAH